MDDYPFEEKIEELMLMSWAWFAPPDVITVRLPEPRDGNGNVWIDPTPPRGLR